MNTQPKAYGILERLDGLSPWAFTGSMYLARWVIVIPIAYALDQLGVSNSKVSFDGSAIVLFFGFIILAPMLETVLECVIPYWLMRKVWLISPGRRPWAFIAVSALIMALLHLGAWPSAILPSLVTGSFLAYTFGHFAPAGLGSAVLHTTVFHGAINLVGWFLIVLF